MVASTEKLLEEEAWLWEGSFDTDVIYNKHRDMFQEIWFDLFFIINQQIEDIVVGFLHWYPVHQDSLFKEKTFHQKFNGVLLRPMIIQMRLTADLKILNWLECPRRWASATAILIDLRMIFVGIHISSLVSDIWHSPLTTFKNVYIKTSTKE